MRMAFQYLICFFTIASVLAADQYQNDYSNFARNQVFKHSQFPSIPPIPPIVMPTIPPFNFPNFPPMPPFSPQDLINKKVGPGVNYNGVVISSSNSAQTDKYGNVIQSGGTKIITNDNGLVKEYSYGNPSNTDIIFTSFSEPRIPKPFAPIPPVRPIDPVVISKFNPGQNEEFQGRSFMTTYHESNINGDKTSGGVATIIQNDNGRVNKKTYKYGDLKDDYD